MTELRPGAEPGHRSRGREAGSAEGTVGDEPAARPTTEAGARWAAWMLAGVIAVAFPLIMYLGRSQWFFLDEWDFLAGRSATSLDDLMRPHNEHWSLLPLLVYRGLFRLVGLHHYWPYQMIIVGLHLLAAVLLWRVMRRARVDPFVATAAASLFALLGSGRQDIEWAFQIGFTGSLVFGLGFLLLTDHDGPLDHRDALGVACGLAGLMCSGIGVTMTVVVGVALLVRRGWRPAMALTAPLAAIYLLWFVTWGHKGYARGSATFSQTATFVRTAVSNTFANLGQVTGVGLVLALALVAGTIMIVIDTPIAELRRRYAATAGLLVGALVFISLTGYGRAGATLFVSDGGARASRYVHLLAAMTLPAVAAAVSHLAQRWRPLIIVAVGLFLVGIVGNVRLLTPTGPEIYALGDPGSILSLTVAPTLQSTPRELQPLRVLAAGMTAGWLMDQKAAGRLPEDGPVPPEARDRAALLLSLEQLDAEPERACRPLAPDEAVEVHAGQEITVPAGFLTVRQTVDGRPGASAVYYGILGRVVRIDAGPLTLRVTASPAGRDVSLCGPG